MSSKKILIIEDDRSIAELERDYLEIAGYEVAIESSGKSGLKRAMSEPYDLIILDLMLPGMDGFNVCKQLREELVIPILVVSAKEEEADKIRGLGLGADDYVTKPFSPAELVARVNSHLARFERLRGRDSRVSSIEIGGLKIHRDSRQVYVDDAEASLTAKEYEILCLLAENPNRVFSKEQIFDAVWGESTYGDIATITVHIRKIREKIEGEPSKPQYIETVWGVGYRFRV